MSAFPDYSGFTPHLASAHALLGRLSDDGYDEDDDADYASDEDDDGDDSDWRRQIQIGEQYQAEVPDDLSPYDDAPPYQNEDRLLWDPNVLSDHEVGEFLRKVQKNKPIDTTNQFKLSQTSSPSSSLPGAGDALGIPAPHPPPLLPPGTHVRGKLPSCLMRSKMTVSLCLSFSPTYR